MTEYFSGCSEDLPKAPIIDNDKKNVKWILLTTDFRCNIDEIVINADKKRYSFVFIYSLSNDAFHKEINVSPSIQKRLKNKISTYLLSRNDGANMKKYSYPFVNGNKYEKLKLFEVTLLIIFTLKFCVFRFEIHFGGIIASSTNKNPEPDDQIPLIINVHSHKKSSAKSFVYSTEQNPNGFFPRGKIDTGVVSVLQK
jgi:hypothetical protein